MVDDRLRCWAAGVQVALELEAAMDNSRHMLDMLQRGEDPASSTTFQTEASNYSLHIGAVDEGVRQAKDCGESAIDLSWVGELRRLDVFLRDPPANEADAHQQFEALDSVLDWLRRDAAGIPEPVGVSAEGPYVVASTDPGGETHIDSVWTRREDALRAIERNAAQYGGGWGYRILQPHERVLMIGTSVAAEEAVEGDARDRLNEAMRRLDLDFER